MTKPEVKFIVFIILLTILFANLKYFIIKQLLRSGPSVETLSD